MTTKRFATRAFNDAGTGRSFKAGEELTNVSAGELANYEHAGLAGDQPKEAAATEPKVDDGKSGDTKTKA